MVLKEVQVLFKGVPFEQHRFQPIMAISFHQQGADAAFRGDGKGGQGMGVLKRDSKLA